MSTSHKLKIGDRVVLVDADGTWPCVVVQIEREMLSVRTDDGRDVCLHYSWFRKIHNRKEVTREATDGGGSCVRNAARRRAV